jgi:hypothetical protein
MGTGLEDCFVLSFLSPFDLSVRGLVGILSNSVECISGLSLFFVIISLGIL